MTHTAMFSDSSKCTVVVGAQWGNEGKGKLISNLSDHSDVCARFNGGANNIHTLSIGALGGPHVGRPPGTVTGEDQLLLRLLPLGVINKKCDIVFGNGMVIHLPTLVQELKKIQSAFDPKVLERIHISNRAHVVFDFHQEMDNVFENLRGSKLGTSQKGIGPAYSTKTIRNGIRIGDLMGDRDTLKDKLTEVVRYFEKYNTGLHVDIDSAFVDTMNAFSFIQDRVTDTVSLMARFINSDKRIVCEGANSVFSDIDFGTYPYVTSSNTTVGAASVGLGIPPTRITNIIGVCKSYTTRTQHWFPSVLDSLDPVSQEITIRGKEFGTTSNQPRRIGWLDLVQVKYAQDLSGFDSLMLTKLDALSGLSGRIGLVVAYKGIDVDKEGYPSTIEEFNRIEPIIDFMDGWDENSLRNVESFSDLPHNAKAYIDRIEKFIGVEITRIHLRDNEIIQKT